MFGPETEERMRALLRGGALETARKKLDLDVTCTGYESPEDKKTLTLIRNR